MLKLGPTSLVVLNNKDVIKEAFVTNAACMSHRPQVMLDTLKQSQGNYYVSQGRGRWEGEGCLCWSKVNKAKGGGAKGAGLKEVGLKGWVRLIQFNHCSQEFKAIISNASTVTNRTSIERREFESHWSRHPGYYRRIKGLDLRVGGIYYNRVGYFKNSLF